MDLEQAKKQVDYILASLFYERMKHVSSQKENSQEIYKQSAKETTALLMHMKGQLDILFGQDTEALTQFLHNAGIVPKP